MSRETLTCFIPAGGEGTRLKPHTNRIPKPMLPMGDPERKLIDYALNVSENCEHILVSTNFDPEKAVCVEEYARRIPGVTILRDKRLAIGAASLIDYFDILSHEDSNGDMVIIPADHVFEAVDLFRFQDYHQELRANITLLVVPALDYGDYALVKDGFVERVVKRKIRDSLSITGVYIIRNRYLLDWIRKELINGWEGEGRSMSRDLIIPAVSKDKVAAYLLPENGYWDDAGTIHRYYNNNMRLSGGRNVISSNAQIAPDVPINSSVVINGPIIDKDLGLNRTIISGSNRDYNITFL